LTGPSRRFIFPKSTFDMRKTLAPPNYTLQTLRKGLAVLETLEAAAGELTLTGLSQRLGESPTVVFRLLKTLEERGFVQQDPASKRYALGLRLWEMGARVVSRQGLVDLARPVLRWLTEVTGETSALVVRRDTDVLYLDIVEGSEPLRVYAEVGARAPIHATASGKAMLAFEPAAVVDAVVAAGMRRLTPLTVTSARALRQRLEEVRRTGLSVNAGERRADIAAVAAPVRNGRGECVAAVSISGPVTRFREDHLELVKRHVRKASEEISARLGHRP
jgi:IclR family acetate operon transcriptional repressor